MEEKYSVKSLYQQIIQTLLDESPPGVLTLPEARQTALFVLEHYLSVTQTDILLDKVVLITYHVYQQMQAAVQRITGEEPVQYVFGEACFYGRSFSVSPAVLIPRQETEELVHWVIRENPQAGLQILDMGTGSGCIAVTLKKEMPGADIYAWDISPEAIQVTQDNAQRHQAVIHTAVVDMMEDKLPKGKAFDIIVSNPPYVLRSETAQMQNNVLKHEPPNALFVEDHCPLLFYERIIELCTKEKLLRKGGTVYVEINEKMGEQLVNLLEANGMKEVALIQDFQNKDRFVKGILPY